MDALGRRSQLPHTAGERRLLTNLIDTGVNFLNAAESVAQSSFDLCLKLHCINKWEAPTNPYTTRILRIVIEYQVHQGWPLPLWEAGADTAWSRRSHARQISSIQAMVFRQDKEINHQSLTASGWNLGVNRHGKLCMLPWRLDLLIHSDRAATSDTM